MIHRASTYDCFHACSHAHAGAHAQAHAHAYVLAQLLFMLMLTPRYVCDMIMLTLDAFDDDADATSFACVSVFICMLSSMMFAYRYRR